MPIWLKVDPHSGIPLYVQLVEQITRAVRIGILQPGDLLPTVRGLAVELRIAPNTIVKAYGELETLGIIETRAGAGTIVRAEVDGLLRRQAVEQLLQRLHELTSDAAALGVSERELREWIEAEVRRAYDSSTTIRDM